MIEMEIKARSNPQAEKKIKKEGKFVKKQKQEDIYFNHPKKDFSKTDEALRLRKENKKTLLTYKGPKIDEKSKSRNEIEEEVENFEKTKNILEALGFEVAGKVKKERLTYKLNEYKITIDDVNNLNKFIELEKEVKELNKEMIDEAIELLKKIGLKERDFETKSYLELLIEKKT